jgi:hypothetical protein
MKITEKTVVIVAILAIVMKLLHWPGANIMLIISLMILSSIYAYFGFALFNNIRLRNIFKKESYKNTNAIRIIGAIGTGIGLSMGIIAILFYSMFWPGALIMMMPALLIMTIVTIITLVKLVTTNDKYYKKILSRLIVTLGLSLFLFLLPFKIKMDWRYPNDPDYVEAYVKYHENIQNPIYKINYEEEKVKLEAKYPHMYK